MNCELFLGRVIFIHLLTLAAMGVVFPLKHGTVGGSSDVNAAPRKRIVPGPTTHPKQKISAFETPNKFCFQSTETQNHLLTKAHKYQKHPRICFESQFFPKRHPWAPLVCEATLPNISDDEARALLAKMPRRKGVERQLLRALVEGCSYEAAWQRLPRKQRWLELWFKGKMDGVSG